MSHFSFVSSTCACTPRIARDNAVCGTKNLGFILAQLDIQRFLYSNTSISMGVVVERVSPFKIKFFPFPVIFFFVLLQ